MCVTFKNVPLNVPDEEILNLCAAYGKPADNIVHYDTLNNIKGKNLPGSTRFVDMELDQGVTFENFYWMEGSMQGDVGKRIVVLHGGQATQCSHCLCRAGVGCPAMGVGRACHALGTERGKMNEYMRYLKDKVGYVSMKIKHAEKQAHMFPSMLGLAGEKSSEQEVQSLWNMEEGELGVTTILNPIEEKDKMITEQNLKIQQLLNLQAATPTLQDKLEKAEAENATLKARLSYTKRVTEQKILDSVSREEGYREDPHLVCVLSATLDEEDFEFAVDPTNDSEEPSLRSRRDFFMTSLKEKADKSNPLQQERLSHVKNQVLDKIRSTKIKKFRSRTDSISSSVGSKRRFPLSDDDQVGRSPSRPRTAPPPACQ